MSQDPVAAIGPALSDPFAAADPQRHVPGQDVVDMRALHAADDAMRDGGAFIRAAPIIEAQPASAMNLQALAGQFSDGLQHGFYAGDIDRLMHKLSLSHQPGSGVTFGDVTVELLNVQAKVGIADAFSKVSSKLSEGLQTMVVRQG